MTPFHEDPSVTLYLGQAVDVLRELPDRSVDCCVTSPPYFGLRDYGVDGQIGAESSPAEYVERLREVFAEVRRVLTIDGTCWLNLGDSYSGRANGGPSFDRHRGGGHRAGVVAAQVNTTRWAPYKSLIGIPWRVAFALQDDGWIIRNSIIWAKPNAMPESVSDRLSNRHEILFMLTRSDRYWFDLDPIREPHSKVSIARAQPHRADAGAAARAGAMYPGKVGQTLKLNQANHPNGRNPGDVWSIATQPFAGAHFAVFPSELARRCIVSGCRPGGLVLDPFSGSGTTGMVAQQNGRRYVGIDLNREYLELSLRTRLRDQPMEFPA